MSLAFVQIPSHTSLPIIVACTCIGVTYRPATARRQHNTRTSDSKNNMHTATKKHMPPSSLMYAT